MAYIRDYEHDVFVSYAHLDNESGGEQPGWVTNFVQDLGKEVRQRLGTKDLTIWIDKKLSGNLPLTPEIMEAVRRSATLLVVMSPAYLNSQWCARERNSFLSFAADCVKYGRIFVVTQRDTEKTPAPEEFGDLLGFRFWTKDEETDVSRPLVRPDKEYAQRVVQLSDDLGKTLRRLNNGGGDGSKAASVQGSGDVSVFLARSTDDLEEREENLKRYLAQAGINVLPRTWYPDHTVAAFTTAMAADLGGCKAFVQLLSASRGRKIEPGGKRYAALQQEIAKTSRRPLLVWRSPDIDLKSIDDDDHRDRLDSARACNFEEFKRAVVEEARREPPRPKQKSANVVAFLDVDLPDMRIAKEVADYLLLEHGIECFWPVRSGKPEELRKDLERQLLECDGLLLVYGSTEPLWVRDQWHQIRKVTSGRERPLAARALFLAPPAEKEELGFKVPVMTIDCREGIKPERLLAFVNELRAQA